MSFSRLRRLGGNKAAMAIVNFNGGHMQGFEVLSKDFPGSEYVKAVDRFLKVKYYKRETHYNMGAPFFSQQCIFFNEQESTI